MASLYLKQKTPCLMILLVKIENGVLHSSRDDGTSDADRAVLSINIFISRTGAFIVNLEKRQMKTFIIVNRAVRSISFTIFSHLLVSDLAENTIDDSSDITTTIKNDCIEVDCKFKDKSNSTLSNTTHARK